MAAQDDNVLLRLDRLDLAAELDADGHIHIWRELDDDAADADELLIGLAALTTDEARWLQAIALPTLLDRWQLTTEDT